MLGHLWCKCKCIISTECFSCQIMVLVSRQTLRWLQMYYQRRGFPVFKMRAVPELSVNDMCPFAQPENKNNKWRLRLAFTCDIALKRKHFRIILLKNITEYCPNLIGRQPLSPFLHVRKGNV